MDITAASTLSTADRIAERIAAFDPFDAAHLQDPAEALRWSRDDAPVFFSPRIGHWVISRHADVKAVLHDPITFSPSNTLERVTPTSEDAQAVLAGYGYAPGRTLVNEDAPAHMPRRQALMAPFRPAALEWLVPITRRLAAERIDRIAHAGRAELIDALLWEVPLEVAMHFLGVPCEDMARLREYSVAHTVNTWGRPQPHEQLAVAHKVGRFWRLAGELLAKLRRDPSGPGWMAHAIRAQALAPEVIPDSYLHTIMMAGIVAAHETTVYAAANALKLLLGRPADWRALRDDPALIPNAIEECLRHDGSIAAWRRRTTREVQVAGVTIPHGARLLLAVASANRDERRFARADRFDIHRIDAGDHLTFGHGPHQCMGKNLARMELRILLEELTQRLPALQLAPQRFSYLPGIAFRGPEQLWAQWPVRHA